MASEHRKLQGVHSPKTFETSKCYYKKVLDGKRIVSEYLRR